MARGREIGQIQSDGNTRDLVLLQGWMRLPAGYADLESVQQVVHFVGGERSRVVETQLRGAEQSPSEVSLVNDDAGARHPRPLATDVDDDRLLSIRDVDGGVIETASIFVKRLPDVLSQMKLARRPELLPGDDGSLWYVARGRESS